MPTKLSNKKLSFKEIFRGFHLKVEFDCVPVTDNPTCIHDYNIMDPKMLTADDNVDIELLVSAYERIMFDVERAVIKKAHGLYMDALKKDIYNFNKLNSMRPDYEDQRLVDQERDEERVNNFYENQL